MPLLRSDYIYTPEGWIENHVLEISADGKVEALRPLVSSDEATYYPGVLSPGWTNAHCHLELSHMKGWIPMHTGMPQFVKQIISTRNNVGFEQQIEAVREALTESWQQGTVAYGDICNTTVSMRPKAEKREMLTRSYIEIFTMDATMAEKALSEGEMLRDEYRRHGLEAAVSGHAPYTMSDELTAMVFQQKEDFFSYHLMESEAERAYFEKDPEPFKAVYGLLGIEVPPSFTGKDSLEEVLDHQNLNDQHVLFVHLTEINAEELSWLAHRFPNAYFCLCPRSNYFIHERYPDIDLFMPFKDRVCLGTDSLASNHSLDLFEEVKALGTLKPELSLHQALYWACTVGAKALGFEEKIGSFAKGQRPGVNWIKGLSPALKLNSELSAEKLY